MDEGCLQAKLEEVLIPDPHLCLKQSHANLKNRKRERRREGGSESAHSEGAIPNTLCSRVRSDQESAGSLIQRNVRQALVANSTD